MPALALWPCSPRKLTLASEYCHCPLWSRRGGLALRLARLHAFEALGQIIDELLEADRRHRLRILEARRRASSHLLGLLGHFAGGFGELGQRLIGVLVLVAAARPEKSGGDRRKDDLYARAHLKTPGMSVGGCRTHEGPAPTWRLAHVDASASVEGGAATPPCSPRRPA